MEGDGKAVGFLLNGTDQSKNRLIGIDRNLLRFSGDQGTGTVAVILHHAEHRKRQSQLLQRALGHLGVVDTAVDQQQVRGSIEALVPCLVVGKTPLHYLVHGSIVILVGKAFQLEALVVAFEGLSILKNHHAGNDVRAGDVGNIKGFYPFWDGNIQHFSKKNQNCLIAFLLVRHPLSFLKGIFAGQLHQAHIVSPLGNAKLGASAILLLHQLGEQLPILQLERKQDMFRGKATAEVVLLHQAGDRLFPIVGGGENLIFLIQQIAVAEMEHRKAGLHLGLAIAHHIRIRQSTRRHQLLLSQSFHGVQPVPQGGGQLELQMIGSLDHLRLDLLRHGLVVSGEQLSGLLHGLAVFGAGFAWLAPTGTLVHMVIEAGALLTHIPRKLLAAGGKLQGVLHRLQDIVSHAPAAERTVIMGTIIRDFAHQRDSGINLLHIQAKVGIALIILQEDVVLGHIPLDQRAFQHQRLKFTGGHNHVKMMDFTYHDAGFRCMGSRVLKVLADPVFQFFRFADIDDLVGFVPHDIHARRIGQRKCFLLQFIKGHVQTPKKDRPMQLLALRRSIEGRSGTGGWVISRAGVSYVKSVNVPLEQSFQCIHSSLSIGTDSAQGNRGTGDNPQGHNTKQALGIHLAALGLQPNAAFKLIGLLYEVGSLSVVQAGFTAHNNFFVEHFHTLLCTTPKRTQ